MAQNALASLFPRSGWNFEVPDVNSLIKPIQAGYQDYRKQEQQAFENERQNKLMALQEQRFGLEQGRFGMDQQRFTREEGERAQTFPLELQSKRAQIAQTQAQTNQIGKTQGIQEYEYARRNGFQGTYQDWQNSQENRSTKYGLNPIPYQKPDGTIGYMVPSTSGQTRALEIPGGGSAMPKATTVQTPTETITQDQFGNVIRREAKDNAGAEFDKTKGREVAQGAVNLPKAEAAYKAYETQNDIVVQDIDRVLKGINWATVGAIGRGVALIPGTPAYDLAQTLETIKANIGFDKLQAMREASPTGGALGAVTEFENKLLQSVLGSLAQAQSAEQIRYNLQRVRDTILEMRQQRAAALAQDRARFGSRPSSPGVPYAQPQVAPQAPAQAPASGGGAVAPGQYVYDPASGRLVPKGGN